MAISRRDDRRTMNGSGSSADPAKIGRRTLLAGCGASVVAVALPKLSDAQPHARVIRATTGSARLLEPGAPATPIWGYDGRVPGPILRVRQGDRLRVQFKNELDQPTTIHWHGIRIDNRMDGVAKLTQEAVAPGESFDYAFVTPDAGTFWYHPHNRSWEQLARGLYGLLIVDEPDPPAVDQDLALIIDDWRLDNAGKIHEASFGSLHDWSHAGRLGNVMTINGEDQVTLPVKSGERVRLRLCNTANARIFRLRLGHESARVIAVDGQPVAAEAFGDRTLQLAPGQRTDLIMDLAEKPGARVAIRETSGRQPTVAGHFAYHATAQRKPRTDGQTIQLPANPLPRQMNLIDPMRVDLVMEGGAMGSMRGARFRGNHMGMRDLAQQGKVWAFNGVVGMTDKPLFAAKTGQTVVMRMVNQTAWPHAMHLHGHHVRELDRAGQIAAKTPWRDTILVERGETVSVAFVADNPGRWMLHCHMLEHQAGGMATWFRVG